MPKELALSTLQSNDYKLEWKNLSAINVGTAGTDSARGFPCLILQLSELGRYKDRHVKDIQAGAMQAHASAQKGSILIAESTSGGEGNFFHDIAKSGWMNSKSSWFTAFFGWHEMAEYRMTPPSGWFPDSEECRLMKELKCDVEQIYWRHVKLHDDMRGHLTAFQREYPATFEEAFASAEGKLIDSVVLLNSLNSKTELDTSQPKILGVDPAGKGDRTALVKRQGYVMPWFKTYNRMDAVTLAQIIMDLDAKENFDHVFIDMGYGHGTFDILWKLGFRKITGVHFGSTHVRNPLLHLNMRAQMASDFQDWMEEGPDGMGGTAKIPDDPEFVKDIRMIPDLEYSGTGQKFKLPSKEEIKDLLGKSPDIFDGAILTFAHPVHTERTLKAGMQPTQSEPQSMLITNNVFDELAKATNGFTNGPADNPNFRFHSFGN